METVPEKTLKEMRFYKIGAHRFVRKHLCAMRWNLRSKLVDVTVHTVQEEPFYEVLDKEEAEKNFEAFDLDQKRSKINGYVLLQYKNTRLFVFLRHLLAFKQRENKLMLIYRGVEKHIMREQMEYDFDTKEAASWVVEEIEKALEAQDA